MNRREFLAASVAGAAMLQQGMKAFGDPATDIQVAIDASTPGAPVEAAVFGGYMEPATTRAWSEMLYDRKFLRPVTDVAPPPSRGFGFRFRGEPWMPVGPLSAVAMDAARPFVGEHSPRITLAGSEERGIRQSGLRLGRGKSYTGRIYLSGDSGASVQVRLVWGPGADDAKSIPVSSLSDEYVKFPLEFESPVDAEDARLEIVGTGNGTFRVGAVSLMPADNVQGFYAGVVRHLKEIGFLMAKWPGGNFVSAYDWHDGLGDPDKRPPRDAPMWAGMIESNDVGLHEFIAFCRLLGAEPYIAVNTGFGEARVAAAEVEYVNGSADTPMGKLRAANGHPQPFNVRLWCIGNEMYGPWQFGHMALDQYWVKHSDFVKAMKKVDPSIQVTSCTASICETSWCAGEQRQFAHGMWQPALPEKTLPFQFGGTEDWDGWMLAKVSDDIDYLSEHTYAYPDLAFDSEKQEFADMHDPLPLRTRRLSNRIGAAFEAWDKYVEKMPQLKQKNIKFIFDEWGTRYRSASGAAGFQRPVGMVTPLSYALFLHEMFRHSGMIGASCPTGGFGTLVLDHTGDAVGLMAEGMAIKIMRDHFNGALPVAVSGNSPQLPVKGTPFVDGPTKPIGSPTFPLDVAAALSSDRQKLILSVVNPSEESRQFAPRISGIKLHGKGTLWRMAAPGVDANNTFGKEPAVRIDEVPNAVLGDTMQVPPISLSVYEFEIANA